VGHVLRAGERFQCTDLRRREDTAEWDATLTDAAIGCLGRRSLMLRFCAGRNNSQRSLDYIGSHRLSTLGSTALMSLLPSSNFN
jgi:hypothetical protein